MLIEKVEQGIFQQITTKKRFTTQQQKKELHVKKSKLGKIAARGYKIKVRDLLFF